MKKNKKLFALIGIVAILAISSVFAYFFKSASIDNPLSTNEYGGEVVEKFTPEEDWEPGEKVDKVVKATNTGDYPLFVRVKFDETWTRTSAAEGAAELITTVASATSADEGFFPTAATTGTTTSVVYKEITDSTDWVLNADGYYYYNKILAAGASTPELLKSLTLCADTSMGKYTTTTKYAVVDTGSAEPTADAYTLTAIPDDLTGKDLYQKSIVALDPANAGYANADYTLTVTVEFCQADSAAGAAQSPAWAVVPTAE